QRFVDHSRVEVVWIYRRRHTQFVKRCEIVFTQLQRCGAEVVFELREFVGANQNRADKRLAQHPRQCDLCGRGIDGRSNCAKPINNLIPLLLVVRKDVECRKAAAVALWVFAGVLAAEETACKRTPDKYSDS